ncbi:MAG: hypothetical protein ISR52_04600 [Rhodospirillales bacterium]|nr:hypothetical protein [Rhodospirillales bacterium]
MAITPISSGRPERITTPRQEVVSHEDRVQAGHERDQARLARTLELTEVNRQRDIDGRFTLDRQDETRLNSQAQTEATEDDRLENRQVLRDIDLDRLQQLNFDRSEENAELARGSIVDIYA